jgi:transcriptional regulator with XRE-family HTH domain
MSRYYQDTNNNVNKYSYLIKNQNKQILKNMKSHSSKEASTASRVKSARLTAKLTQKQLSDMSGISQPAISMIESGEIRATGYAAILARCLGVTAEWLEFGSETNNEITPQEKAMIELFRSLPPDKEAAVIDQLLYNVERADSRLLAQQPLASYFTMLTKFKHDIEKKGK